MKSEVIDPYDVDTDDELNELREAQKRGKVSKPTLPAKTSVADMYGEETDEEDEKPDMEIKQNFVKTVENVVKKEVIDPYDVDTDIGKRHALKRYEQFLFKILATISNMTITSTLVVHFHEIFEK